MLNYIIGFSRCTRHWRCVFLVLLLAPHFAPGQELALRLEAAKGKGSNEWVYLSSAFASNTLLTLEASTNLHAWRTIGTFHDELFPYPDLSTPQHPQQFYRLKGSPRGPTNDWKNQISFPVEPFCTIDVSLSHDEYELGWVKFAILLDKPEMVFYQDSRKYLFHYDFARERLPAFKGMDSASFDAVSLYGSNHQVVLGTVFYPLGRPPEQLVIFPECGVQFVGLEPYSPDQIAAWFALVKASIASTNLAEVFYMPTFEQRQVAITNAEAFAERGIPVSSVDRWFSVDATYSSSWALGQLKYFPGQEVATAFADGRLRPEDILLVDGVPTETPLVAGIITLSPATPNSHAVILSQSFGIPFVYLSDESDRQRVQQLFGRKILLRAGIELASPLIRILDVDGKLEPEFEAELLAAKRPRPIEFKPKQAYGALSASTDILVPSDIQFFGGKAANYGLLRRAISNNCPVAIAFSFDLWDSFLDQVLPSGKSLRNEIGQRLVPFTNYPPDMTSLKTTLAGIRDSFKRTARFAPAQQEAIIAALAPLFDANRKIRFRSSTNVEDSEHFTGAGLYDSYSGCLADDLDGNTSGPCACDASENEERGVFRAIQKVYASFYNDNAFLERLAHGVDESNVAMGVLVHHSFPDKDELANGVAKMQFKFSGSEIVGASGEMVTQLRAEPVANPSGNSSPEIFSFLPPQNPYAPSQPFIKQYSSLVPLGQPVLGGPYHAEYYSFISLFNAAAKEFRKYYPDKDSANLDFEYKKDRNLGLVVKQVRELPDPAAADQQIGFLVDDPQSWSVAQKERVADVFTHHRLKCLWTVHTINARLTSSNLLEGIYTEGTFQYVEDGVVRTLTGPISSWPDAAWSPSGGSNFWTTGSGPNQRSWQLRTDLTTAAKGTIPPVFTQADYPKTLTVTYATPVMGVTNETVVLELAPSPNEPGALQQRTMSKTNVVKIQTSFHWKKPDVDLMVNYTAPLLRFAETRITGLTTEPIVLKDYFSQTYVPGHHNQYEYFLFEPRLEPGMRPDTLMELQSQNIKYIHVLLWTSPGNASISAIGFDDQSRQL